MSDMAIRRYEIEGFSHVTLELPERARILTLQTLVDQPGHDMTGGLFPPVERVYLWALVDPEAPVEERHFTHYGTGHPIPNDPGEYIGTYQLFNGQLVWHLFEDKK